MASFVLGTVTSKLPALVEQFEPQLEKGLRNGLNKLKTEHPDHAANFLANWNKLNSAVQAELAVATAPQVLRGVEPLHGVGRRSKRTRTRRHRK